MHRRWFSTSTTWAGSPAVSAPSSSCRCGCIRPCFFVPPLTLLLQLLSCENNCIPVLPPEFSGCRLLTEVNLGCNAFEIMPEGIKTITTLQVMAVRRSCVELSLTLLPQRLRLASNSICIVPQWIGNLTNLNVGTRRQCFRVLHRVSHCLHRRWHCKTTKLNLFRCLLSISPISPLWTSGATSCTVCRPTCCREARRRCCSSCGTITGTIITECTQPVLHSVDWGTWPSTHWGVRGEVASLRMKLFWQNALVPCSR